MFTREALVNSRLLRSFPLILFWALSFVFVATVCEAASKPLDAPPTGIVPTSMTLKDVLAGFDRTRASNHWSTLIEDGKVTMYGINGTFREANTRDDYKETVDIGILSYKVGKLDGQEWFQNSNGIVALQHDTHQESEIASAALSQHAHNNDAGLVLTGEAPPPLSAYVVEVHAPGGRHEWQFYDKRTFQLVRSEQVYPDKRLVVTYDDFRTIDGITSAWHSHQSDGRSQNDEDYVTINKRFNTQVPTSDLAMPPSREDLVQFPTGVHSVKLPSQIIYGRVIIRVTIGNRGYDFLLDSGASSIVLDAGVASSLGLTMFGESVQSAAGSFHQKQALIPEMRVGDIIMKNVIVDTTSFIEQPSWTTKVVGLLGFDFIANAAVKIDYLKGVVEATPAYLFVPPADGVALDAVWDDGVPRIPVQVGDVSAHFIFDTGADRGVIYQRFAQAHRDVMRDAGEPGRASGVGGSFTMRSMSLKVLTVAGVDFRDFRLAEIVNNPGFEYEDYDGLLGYQLLKYFTVYINYGDSHIYLVRNGQQ